MDGWVNKLYLGDNLTILREHVPDESVDLIYLDPPFNSNATYNVLFKEQSGKGSTAQITAFEDTWEWGPEADLACHEVVKHGPPSVGSLVEALLKFLGRNNMMAYLSMMAIRLVELYRVLKPGGSLWLHCDPTASHYLKLLLDAIFGHNGFRNEVIWKRTPFSGSSKAKARQLPRSHDVILFYSKGALTTWVPPAEPYSEEYVARFRYEDERGKYRKTLLKTYSQETLERLRQEGRLIPPSRPAAHYSYKQYLHESSGQRQIDDVWVDINMLNPMAKERLGYPTQKPRALLERIIEAATREDDLVMDPFCGCGTAIEAAEKLSRRWIGIDITHLAISLVKNRLRKAFEDQPLSYEVLGDPKDVESAQALLKEKDGRYKFEWWAVGLVEAQPAHDKKKGSDKGVDGYIRFVDDASGEFKRIVVQVKSGKVGVSYVRDLVGVMKREKAQIGALLTLEGPTRAMLTEASEAGYYEPPSLPNRRFPRVQILTIADLLEGRARLEYPRLADVTFKRAQRVSKERPVEQGQLGM